MANMTKRQKQQMQQAKKLHDFLTDKLPAISEAASFNISGERLVKAVYAELQGNEKLVETAAQNPASLAISVMESGYLGLEPGGVLGESYLIPYGSEVTLQIGYRGLLKLARRSGQIAKCAAHVVRENDEFDYSLGLEPDIIHKPALDEDRGDLKYAYFVAKLTNGEFQDPEVMNRREIEAIRERSQAWKSGRKSPWETDPDMMWRKTVAKRGTKYLPMETQARQAVEIDNMRDAGEKAQLPGLGSAYEQVADVADVRKQVRSSGRERLKNQLGAGESEGREVEVPEDEGKGASTTTESPEPSDDSEPEGSPHPADLHPVLVEKMGEDAPSASALEGWSDYDLEVAQGWINAGCPDDRRPEVVDNPYPCYETSDGVHDEPRYFDSSRGRGSHLKAHKSDDEEPSGGEEEPEPDPPQADATPPEGAQPGLDMGGHDLDPEARTEIKNDIQSIARQAGKTSEDINEFLREHNLGPDLKSVGLSDLGNAELVGAHKLFEQAWA